MSQTILLVDDEEDFLETVEFFLTKQNFSVCTASDGEKALEKVKAKTPDLILLDIMMPVMDGLEMCRCIKTNTRLKDIPVIILTAKGQKEDFQKALKAGADDFVVKPFDFDHLLQKISGIFDVKRADKNPGGKRG